MFKELYKKHKCSLMLPLVFLIIIDLIAFFHIADDIVVVDISTRTELIIFTITMLLTFYYISKQRQNIREYICVTKKTFKRWFKW